MTQRARCVLVLCAAIVAAALMVWGFSGLAPFGHYPGPYGDVIDALATRQRHVLNAVTAVNFDYRGLDTLVEEYIFFAAIAGLTVIARKHIGEERTEEPIGEPVPPLPDVVAWFCRAMMPVVAGYGIYIAIHAILTPGGGFQGGAIEGSAFAFAFIGLGYVAFKKFAPPLLEPTDAVGAAGYAVTGIATLVASGAFLANVLPFGKTGALVSGGTMWLVNACVFVEVAAGIVVMFSEYAEFTRVEVSR